MSSNVNEKRILDQVPTSPRMSTERTNRLLKNHLLIPRWVSIDRACLYTEAFIKHSSDSLPIRRAKAYRYVLENIPIAIQTGELLVGSLTERPNGAILFPEVSINGMRTSKKTDHMIRNTVSAIAGVVIKLLAFLFPRIKDLQTTVDLFIELKLDSFESRPTHPFKIDKQARRELHGLIRFWKKRSAVARFQKLMSTKVRRRTGMKQLVFAVLHQFTGGVKQFYADLGKIVEFGAQTLLDEVNVGVAHAANSEKARFYEASAIALQGLLSFSDRYASLADSMADTVAKANEREELRRIAEICRNVPRKPAKTFREAFQSVWFTYLALVFDDGGMEIPFGRLDQILWPYYRDDLAAGRLTKGEAIEIIEAFFIKASEMEFLLDNAGNRIEDGNSARMTLTLGGIGRDGQDSTNELSYLFLDVAGRARTLQPNVAIRIHPTTQTDFFDSAMEVIASGANTIQLFNDETIITGLTSKAVVPEDARDYIITGCVQPLPFGGYGSTCASHIYLPRTLILFLKGNKLTYRSYNEFLDAYKDFMKIIIKDDVAGIAEVDEAHLVLPNPLVSACVPGSLERGIDAKEGGARYNLTGISLSGLGTLADSLQAIETLVFKDRTHSLSDIVKMTKKNFYGFEIDRQHILNKIPKYGNDIPEVDNRASGFTDFVVDELEQYSTFRGGKFLLGLHTEANHVIFGLFTGSTPDGRRMGDPWSVGAGSASGRDKSGYTAFLNSVVNTDFNRVSGGTSVNIRVNPNLLKGKDQLNRFGSMIQTYFKKGGPHIQANIVSTETLKDAQLHPERYSDLLVRISGFSARFVELTRETQNEIIARSEPS